LSLSAFAAGLSRGLASCVTIRCRLLRALFQRSEDIDHASPGAPLLVAQEGQRRLLPLCCAHYNSMAREIASFHRGFHLGPRCRWVILIRYFALHALQFQPCLHLAPAHRPTVGTYRWASVPLHQAGKRQHAVLVSERPEGSLSLQGQRRTCSGHDSRSI